MVRASSADEIAAAATAATASGPAHLILISDMQAGSQIESLQVYAWPDQLRLDVRPVVDERANKRLGDNSGDRPRHRTEDTDRVRVRVSNSADATESRFRIGWARGSQQTTGEVEL